ncbi:MAG: hypothetical protein KKA62_01140 [Nanoarchaeota archaeon]|nr:hypothetical protein [Nanoarchaeota archaeon]MBU1643963.1 hypothetical protein [Nanoarchaeota archaeon]MBU1976540.1 hypothetical protein [Nanoarchaeota archaeon]
MQKTQKIENVVVENIGNAPEKKFKAGTISATVWLNRSNKPNGESSEYRTISLERSYKDREDKWQSTNSLRTNDLPKAKVVLQKAYEFIVLNNQDLFKGVN